MSLASLAPFLWPRRNRMYVVSPVLVLMRQARLDVLSTNLVRFARASSKDIGSASMSTEPMGAYANCLSHVVCSTDQNITTRGLWTSTCKDIHQVLAAHCGPLHSLFADLPLPLPRAIVVDRGIFDEALAEHTEAAKNGFGVARREWSTTTCPY